MVTKISIEIYENLVSKSINNSKNIPAFAEYLKYPQIRNRFRIILQINRMEI